MAGSLLPRWRGVDRVYEEVGAWLDQRGVGHDVVVMANNPPALWYHTGRPSVVVPAPVGDVETLLAVADRYEVTYVVLDHNWGIPSHKDIHPRLHLVAVLWDRSSRVVLYGVTR